MCIIHSQKQSCSSQVDALHYADQSGRCLLCVTKKKKKRFSENIFNVCLVFSSVCFCGAFRLNAFIPTCVIVSTRALLYIIDLTICICQPDSHQSSDAFPHASSCPSVRMLYVTFTLGFKCHHGSHLLEDYF